jgi:hypothetical protein
MMSESFRKNEAFEGIAKFIQLGEENGIKLWGIKSGENGPTLDPVNFIFLYRYKGGLLGEQSNVGVFSTKGNSAEEIHRQVLKLDVPQLNTMPEVPRIDSIPLKERICLSGSRIIYAVLTLSDVKDLKEEAMLCAIEQMTPADVILEMQRVIQRQLKSSTN